MADTSISLLERLRLHSDPASWQRLADLYEPWIRGWVHRYVLQKPDADELVQEVLAQLVREFPAFPPDPGPGAFRRWLRTVMVNSLRSFWYARRTRGPASGGSGFEKTLERLADPDSAISRLWDEEHDQYVVRRLVELIEPEFERDTWRAFQQLVLEGRPTAEVAAELAVSPNLVRIAKARVQSRLRQEALGLID